MMVAFGEINSERWFALYSLHVSNQILGYTSTDVFTHIPTVSSNLYRVWFVRPGVALITISFAAILAP